MALAHCPSHDELAGYIRGKLDEPRVDFVSQHVEQCPMCESTVVELERAADSVLISLRNKQPTEYSHEPQCRDAMLQVAAMPRPTVVRTQSGSSPQHAQSSSPSAAHVQVSVEDMAHRLVASGLMSAAEVQAFIDKLPAAAQLADGQGLAREMVKAGVLTKYQANVLYHGRTKGLVYGDYRVLDKIGAGGMGQVLKAQHRRMKRIVALKLLTSAATRKPGAARRFEREVEAAARLEHSNIITAYDAGEHDGVLYLVMQFVDGPDLASLVKQQGPLPVRDAVGYVVQAGRGLAYAHERGVIHRDIKPSNLLVDAAGTVQVLDMGLARLMSDELAGDDGLTSTGQVMGTADFMAPEQALDTKTADARSDIYSLGCTLFWLLTGKSVYAGDTLMARLLAHREQPIPSLRTACPDAPQSLERVLSRMLAKRPQDRYATMKQCLVELQGALAANPPQERPLRRAAPLPEKKAAAVGDRGVVSPSAESSARLPPPRPPAPKPPVTADFKRPAPRAAASPPPARGASDGEAFMVVAGRPLQRTPRRGIGKTLLTKPPLLISAAAVALATLGLATLALAVIVLRFRTNEGTVVVELNEPGATVMVDGKKKFTLSREGEPEPIQFEIESGKHLLEVTKGGFKTQTRKFTVESGGRTPIKVALVADTEPAKPAETETAATELPAKPPKDTRGSDATGKSTDLLALVDPERDAVRGNWTRTAEGLVSDGRIAYCRLRLPCELPAEYDYRVEFTAGGGNDILLILSSGTTNFTLLMGGWGGRWDGFDAVRGHPFQREGTGIIGQASRVRRGQRHTALVQVRRDSVAAFIDGQLVARHPTDYADLDIPRAWDIGGGLGLGTTFNRVVFHTAELIEVDVSEEEDR